MTFAEAPMPGANPLEIRLLGGFAVRRQDGTLAAEPWPSLRAMHLVQLLALGMPAQRMPRDQVIETLWPHLDPQAGAANLRKAAHLARQALGRQDSVVLQAGMVLLAPASQVVVDARQFEQQARAALQSGAPDACALAAAGYGGELLPAARYEAWTEPRREQLRALQLRLLRQAGQWEALAELDPCDEEVHRLLMRRELEAGNRSAAIHWYAHLRHAMQQELGMAPSAQSQDLYRRAAQEPQAGGAFMVGRELLRAQHHAWLLQTPSQRPAGILVQGPAGIGKSALAHAFADMAGLEGWSVVSVAAASPGLPYGTLTAAVDRLLLGQRALLDAIGAPARSVLGMLTPLAGPAEAPAGPISRHQVVGAIRRLLLAASDTGRVLLQIDDAHLLQEAEVDVVLHLMSAGPPLLVWLAARNGSKDSALARGAQRLADAGRLRHVALGPLSASEMGALIAAAAPAPLQSETSASIVALAEGNPFVALELLHSTRVATARLPANVAEAITRRLCDVNATALELLRRMALCQERMDAGTATALASAGEAQAFAMLDAALAAGVLVVEDAHYRFGHALVRQALIDQIAPHQRLKLHREIAHQLSQQDVAPALVARHWVAGGSMREATPWLLAAAQAALRLAAFSDTLSHLEPVLNYQPRQAEALRLRAEALEALGDARAVSAYRAAADADGGPYAQDLRVKAALAQIKQGDPKGGVQALQGLSPSTPEGRLCEALAYSGAAALGAVDPAVGSAKSREARRLALASGDTAALVIASWAHAAAAHARGELHRTVYADLQDTSQLPHLAVRVFDGQLCMLQRFLYGARPYPQVIAFAQSLADEARRLGAARGEAFGITIRGEAELLAGDLDAAEVHLRRGRALHRALGAATGESFALQRLAEVAMQRGQLAQAHEWLDQSLDLACQTDIGFHLFDRIYGTRIALADLQGRGRAELLNALESVRGPLETCPGCRITFAVPAAIAAARAGELAHAQALHDQSAYLAQVVMRLPGWHAAHAEVQGQLALAQGEPRDIAAAHFANAAQQFQAAGQVLDAARCVRKWQESSA